MRGAEHRAVRPIGQVHSRLRRCADAPKQGHEGAPDARVEVFPGFVAGLDGLRVGSYIVLLTWLHRAQRTLLQVHPRDDARRPLKGVFATRSADRPNPIGLHRVRLLGIHRRRWLDVAGLEAIDGTPVIDIKPWVSMPRPPGAASPTRP